MGDYEEGMFSFAKLNGQDDWKQWWRSMEYALADFLLLNHVTGKTSRPEANTPGAVERQEKWDEKDARAAAKSRAMCSPGIQRNLDGISGKSAFQKYELLKKRCAASGLAAKWSAFTKLVSISYGGCKDIQDLTIQMQSVHMELKDLEAKIEDFVLFSLLNNLSPEWSQYRTVLTERAMTCDAIDFDDIVKGLEDHERTMKNVDNAEAFVNARKQYRKRGSKEDFKGDSSKCSRGGKDSSKGSRCDCCGRTGHVKENCSRKHLSCHSCGKPGHLKLMCQEITTPAAPKIRHITCYAMVRLAKDSGEPCEYIPAPIHERLWQGG